MTLKEKLKERLYNQSHDDSECLRIRFENIDKVIDSQEVIADDFAIGFAKWTSYKCKYLETKGWFSNSYELEMGIFKSSKELLEIYKKEKGL